MEFHKQEYIIKKTDEKGKKDLKEFFALFLDNWYWFLISIIICTGLATIYAFCATEYYKVNSAITINDQTNTPPNKSLDNSTMDFSDMLQTPNNANNEIDILKSNNLITNVAKTLNLNVTIYKKGIINSSELFNEAPFDVKVIERADSIKFQKFNIKISNDIVNIDGGLDDINSAIKFGQVIKCGQFDLVFTRKPGFPVEPDGYKLTVQSIDSKVEKLAKNLTIDLSDKKGTTVDLSFEYPNPKKGEAILQQLMTLYLKSNLDNKNRIADSSLAFIDNRLKIVTGELANVETQFTAFKQENSITDVDQQSKSLVSNVSDYNNKLNDQQVQLSILDDIGRYVNSSENKKLIPSSLAVQDPVFANAIGSYNNLLNQKGQLSLSYKDSNPIMQNLDTEIESVRQSLLKSFNSYRKSLLISVNALKSQNSTLNGQVKSAPKKEMAFLDYSRQQNLKQELYLYLLQKREEIAIAKTSNISTVRIIDPAKSDYEPFKPNKILVIFIGFFLGVLIPWSYKFTKEWLNNRILNKTDIQSYTNVTILGEIDSSDKNSALVIEKNSRAKIVEQFRSLRTNLLFQLDSEKSNVILITSSMGGEGKSFITLNLAGVLALSGKKVVMVELDLHKPKLAKNIKLEYKIGLSDYIGSDKIYLTDVIKPTSISNNVHIVPAGLSISEPSELLLSDRLKLMIEALKNQFDYVLIDSPPVGLVSDSLILEKFADVTLYVARQGFTYKSQLNILNDLIATKKLKHACLIINDIKDQRRGYYGYDDANKYGYGYTTY